MCDLSHEKMQIKLKYFLFNHSLLTTTIFFIEVDSDLAAAFFPSKYNIYPTFFIPIENYK